MNKIISITFNGTTRDVSFTDAQASVMRRLIDGERIEIINRHWQNGGEHVWHKEDGDYSYGKELVRYKAFNGAMYAIQSAFGCGIGSVYQQYIINF